MSGLLIVLGKWPGFCPVDVREIWRRLFAKYVMRFAVPEATNMCQYYQICASYKMGIYGAIHGVQDILTLPCPLQVEVFLLVDRKTVCNEINQIRMLSRVFQLYSSGAHFVFFTIIVAVHRLS